MRPWEVPHVAEGDRCLAVRFSSRWIQDGGCFQVASCFSGGEFFFGWGEAACSDTKYDSILGILSIYGNN